MALLLIDLQNEGGTSNVVSVNQILKNTVVLMKRCRGVDIPILCSIMISTLQSNEVVVIRTIECYLLLLLPIHSYFSPYN